MKNKEFERISVAIGLGEATTRELTALHQPREAFRWAKPENLHISLRTIGEVDRPLRDALSRELAQLSVEPFILQAEGVGVFPTRGQPQVVYTGLGSAHPRLFQLHHRIEQILARLGFPLELKTFYPHITLARVSRASVNSVREFIKSNRDFATAAFKVNSFGIYQTDYTHQGAFYTPLEIFPLQQKRKANGEAV